DYYCMLYIHSGIYVF
nr:immunoglobulin light chain junction region [Macaca mulatta]